MTSVPGIQITGDMPKEYESIWTPDAQTFIRDLARQFGPKRGQLLIKRQERQAKYDAGMLPDFPAETANIRKDKSWKGAAIAPDLSDRRVEITGPADNRKMVINAMNSGATHYMADLEDSSAPAWKNMMEGQINIRDAVNGSITFDEGGKHYALNPKTAVPIVRPRGWHLPEHHVLVEDEPISGALMDFGLAFFHNAKNLIEKSSASYFYLPKMEHYEEARLWNEVFRFSQTALGIPQGTIRATVLIETLPAAFQMPEIIYELKDHIAGLNAGRWDYLFSTIKTLAAHEASLLPDRGSLTMTKPFMAAYAGLLVQTCHERGIHAMGGMAAQIPNKKDPAANDKAMALVRQDKITEARDRGHDGTWVAHPGLVPLARGLSI
jgi:malate synthase